jgi:hypothetical protein
MQKAKRSSIRLEDARAVDFGPDVTPNNRAEVFTRLGIMVANFRQSAMVAAGLMGKTKRELVALVAEHPENYRGATDEMRDAVKRARQAIKLIEQARMRALVCLAVAAASSGGDNVVAFRQSNGTR